MGDVAMPLLPPGGLMEIVFSFDTTGSMSRAIEEVKGRVQDMIQRLQADIPGIRIGVVAHGDYCDKDVFYLEKHVDLTNNVAELCGLVKDVEGTGGGDPEECYEYVLHMVSGFSWTPGSQKVLVMIGDATPHEPDYDLNVDNLDWRKEAENLANMGVKIYCVQAFDNEGSKEFFEALVAIMSGQHLQLGQFSNVCDLIMAICYREVGGDFLEGYEAEVRARNRRKMNKDLEGIFGTLKRGDSAASAKSGGAGPLVRDASIRSNGSRSRSGSPVPSDSGSEIKVVKAKKVKAKKVKVKKVKLPDPKVKVVKAKIVKAKKVKLSNPKVQKADAGAVAQKSRSKRDKELATRRNLVNDTDFVLQKGNLKKRWTKWRPAMSAAEPKSKRNWTERSGSTKATRDKLGWRRNQLFPAETSNARALYEFAVQTKPRGKFHVVYCKWSTLNADQSTWERTLLNQRIVQDEIESVLKQGCRVFARRFETRRLGKNQKQSLSDFRKLYKYSWPELKLTVKDCGKRQKVVFE